MALHAREFARCASSALARQLQLCGHLKTTNVNVWTPAPLAPIRSVNNSASNSGRGGNPTQDGSSKSKKANSPKNQADAGKIRIKFPTPANALDHQKVLAESRRDMPRKSPKETPPGMGGQNSRQKPEKTLILSEMIDKQAGLSKERTYLSKCQPTASPTAKPGANSAAEKQSTSKQTNKAANRISGNSQQNSLPIGKDDGMVHSSLTEPVTKLAKDVNQWFNEVIDHLVKAEQAAAAANAKNRTSPVLKEMTSEISSLSGSGGRGAAPEGKTKPVAPRESQRGSTSSGKALAWTQVPVKKTGQGVKAWKPPDTRTWEEATARRQSAQKNLDLHLSVLNAEVSQQHEKSKKARQTMMGTVATKAGQRSGDPDAYSRRPQKVEKMLEIRPSLVENTDSATNLTSSAAWWPYATPHDTLPNISTVHKGRSNDSSSRLILPASTTGSAAVAASNIMSGSSRHQLDSSSTGSATNIAKTTTSSTASSLEKGKGFILLSNKDKAKEAEQRAAKMTGRKTTQVSNSNSGKDISSSSFILVDSARPSPVTRNYNTILLSDNPHVAASEKLNKKKSADNKHRDKARNTPAFMKDKNAEKKARKKGVKESKGAFMVGKKTGAKATSGILRSPSSDPTTWRWAERVQGKLSELQELEQAILRRDTVVGDANTIKQVGENKSLNQISKDGFSTRQVSTDKRVIEKPELTNLKMSKKEVKEGGFLPEELVKHELSSHEKITKGTHKHMPVWIDTPAQASSTKPGNTHAQLASNTCGKVLASDVGLGQESNVTSSNTSKDETNQDFGKVSDSKLPEDHEDEYERRIGEFINESSNRQDEEDYLWSRPVFGPLTWEQHELLRKINSSQGMIGSATDGAKNSIESNVAQNDEDFLIQHTYLMRKPSVTKTVSVDELKPDVKSSPKRERPTGSPIGSPRRKSEPTLFVTPAEIAAKKRPLADELSSPRASDKTKAMGSPADKPRDDNSSTSVRKDSPKSSPKTSKKPSQKEVDAAQNHQKYGDYLTSAFNEPQSAHSELDAYKLWSERLQESMAQYHALVELSPEDSKKIGGNCSATSNSGKESNVSSKRSESDKVIRNSKSTPKEVKSATDVGRTNHQLLTSPSGRYTPPPIVGRYDDISALSSFREEYLKMQHEKLMHSQKLKTQAKKSGSKLINNLPAQGSPSLSPTRKTSVSASGDTQPKKPISPVVVGSQFKEDNKEVKKSVLPIIPSAAKMETNRRDPLQTTGSSSDLDPFEAWIQAMEDSEKDKVAKSSAKSSVTPEQAGKFSGHNKTRTKSDMFPALAKVPENTKNADEKKKWYPRFDSQPQTQVAREIYQDMRATYSKSSPSSARPDGDTTSTKLQSKRGQGGLSLSDQLYNQIKDGARPPGAGMQAPSLVRPEQHSKVLTQSGLGAVTDKGKGLVDPARLPKVEKLFTSLDGVLAMDAVRVYDEPATKSSKNSRASQGKADGALINSSKRSAASGDGLNEDDLRARLARERDIATASARNQLIEAYERNIEQYEKSLEMYRAKLRQARQAMVEPEAPKTRSDNPRRNTDY